VHDDAAPAGALGFLDEERDAAERSADNDSAIGQRDASKILSPLQ
jgi:hypothetical protein